MELYKEGLVATVPWLMREEVKHSENANKHKDTCQKKNLSRLVKGKEKVC